MPSDMTTAEMAEYMTKEAGCIGVVADALRDGAPTSARVADQRVVNYTAIAARLEALDRVAKAAKAMLKDGRVSDFTEFVCEESLSIVVHAALKEAGYGE